jgi:L-iditol 2-dehydrogenase
MKKVAITGESQAGLVDSPDPKAKGNWVVVKIHATPMCTEFKAFKNGKQHKNLGHEAAGEVVDVAQPGKVKVGDRVVVMPQSPCGKCPLCLVGDYIHCRNILSPEKETGCGEASGTYAQYVIRQDWLLVPIPDGMSYDRAGMACCALGPTLNAVEEMNVNAFDTLLITGMGPVGLGGVIHGVLRGARVIAVEGHPYRANLAKKLGAAEVIDPTDENALERIMELTGGLGVDKAVDCAGVPEAQRLLIDAIRRRGQIVFVAEGGELTIHTSRDMIRKGLTLRGVWHYNLGLTPKMMGIVERAGDLLDTMTTHTFAMRDIQKAWELQLTGECGKVILHPWE